MTSATSTTRASRRLYLHVGLPKTGTTMLQELMWLHRDSLADGGLLYPGQDPAAQHRAAMDVHAGRYRQWHEPGVVGSWSSLVERLRSWHGDAVFSTELLAPASPDEARQVREALHFAEIHVVCTVRDFARQVPSVWQENVKTRHTTSFDELLAALRSPELTDVSRGFWDFQDLPRVLRTWGASLPPERVHVVTVPRRGGSTRVLWERFAAVLGVDARHLHTDVGSHNQSLGFAETELLRRVNVALGDDLDWPRYAEFVKDHVAATILARRESPRLALPADAHDWARHAATRFVGDITDSGYHIVGDLDDLLPEPPDPDAQPAEADQSRMLAAAVETIATLAREEPRPSDGPPPPDEPRPGMAGVLDAVRRASDDSPPLNHARRLYRRVRPSRRA
ncbi:hypothetical protein [Saccharomonospora piscinae]|uniref:hypothetical protein n=1 Tax=Saccharomonospora piscinae TaxID=687388 RepID=UPI0004654D97|nr:hypothetical protein [Saccharomonospora piscinae]